MNPALIAQAGTEAAHQSAFMCWCQQSLKTIDPRLNFAFHVPNGGLRDKITASRMKSQGVKPGVPDVFIPIPNYLTGKHGLWIEFKRPSHQSAIDGGMSKEQIIWRDYLISQNYDYFLSHGYLPAIDYTLNYLGIKQPGKSA